MCTAAECVVTYGLQTVSGNGNALQIGTVNKSIGFDCIQNSPRYRYDLKVPATVESTGFDGDYIFGNGHSTFEVGIVTKCL